MLAQAIERLRCKRKVVPFLSPYLDQELSDSETAKVTQHLRDCLRCRTECEALSLSRRALAIFEIPPSRSQWTNLAVKKSGWSEADSRFRQLCKSKIAVPLPLAAGLVLGVCTGLVVLFLAAQPAQPQVAQEKQLQPEITRIVEVPVERVVVRTVYLKPGSDTTARRIRKSGNRIFGAGPSGDVARNRRKRPESQAIGVFRPASSANLRVVKERDR